MSFTIGTLTIGGLRTGPQGPPGATTAAGTSYDGTTSGLAATTVQAAIDEVVAPTSPVDSASTAIAIGTQVDDGIAAAYSAHGRSLYCTAATAVAVTADSGTAGTVVALHQTGAGQVQVSAGVGVTLRQPAVFLTRTAQQYSALVLEWRTATEVWVGGDLEAAP